MKLTPVQRTVLTALAAGATTRRERDLDRLAISSADGGIRLGQCQYATWAALVRRGLAAWHVALPFTFSHPGDLRITPRGRDALEATQP